MNKKKLIKDIESGKQRGYSKKLIENGICLWSAAAIQKYEEKYRVHVSVIKEENMEQEEYDIYFTREISTIEEAFKSVRENGKVQLNEFKALKGQKIFNPNLIEENNL